jgi:hypothetical protein
MVDEKIIELKNKLDYQIDNNDVYEKIYKTSAEIDELIIEYYKQYGLSGVK